MKVDLTEDQVAVVIMALQAYLTQTRHEYEDELDVGGNVQGLRARRDLIKSAIEAIEGGDS